MHEKDRALIQSVQGFFGNIGYVSKVNNTSTVEFRVSTLKDLVGVILPHFDKYSLKTQKRLDYLLFKEILFLMLNKEHTTLDGIQKIVNIKASLNTGLSKDLKDSFPKSNPTTLKTMESYDTCVIQQKSNNLHPEWLAGFCTGESNFFIAVQKSKTKSESFIHFFGGGFVMKYKQRSVCEYTITKIDLIIVNIIPFFDKHPILGSKHLNFLDFKTAAHIIKNKEHLNEDGLGLNQILELKRRITSVYSNKAINNHNVIYGTEKPDQKR
ncbi:hypothetical protein HYALB_00008463 [Hymenoscyphus albidus]|uniref:Homing endonuclease LAGLIDADG domain-containing protein n=1 Tax=Hymenoscyphus albidus TaxID=595503 RepID=A0A9N9PVP7_9HELO|nr:hypothetical protein HYALB_00008463 [Hymenoscyphus albidus]